MHDHNKVSLSGCIRNSNCCCGIDSKLASPFVSRRAPSASRWWQQPARAPLQASSSCQAVLQPAKRTICHADAQVLIAWSTPQERVVVQAS
mmetsp:Transcript_27388/g.81172  ORF Transcript_27388/g.81172 Transcript_27388/m.81172 type:complete len:91 (-) Transcript_27388:562-834(-)